MSEKKDRIETVTGAPDTVTESPETVTKAPETTTGPVVDLEAEKLEGTKEVAVNSEAAAIAQAQPESEKVALPSFFVKKEDRRRIDVDILTSASDGRIVSVSRTGLGLNFAKEFPNLRHGRAWFDFSSPNYEDMSTYRQRSAVWRREAQQTVVDKLQLRNFLLVWHLKDWSLTDENGKKVELVQEEGGALTDESLAKVYAVNPTLIDVVLTLFEKDVLMT